VKITGATDASARRCRGARVDRERGSRIALPESPKSSPGCNRSRSRARIPAARQPVAHASGGEAATAEARRHLAEAGRPQRETKEASSCCSMSRPPACTSRTSRKLLRAFPPWFAAGHSLIFIEHNLDVIRAAGMDHRPGAGRRAMRGGEIVCVGAPDEVKKSCPPIPARRCSLRDGPRDPFARTLAPKTPDQRPCEEAPSRDSRAHAREPT